MLNNFCPKPSMLITTPKPRELSYHPPTDIEILIKDFIGHRVFHEDDLHAITYQIENLLNHYKKEAYDALVFREIEQIKYFIRILNYGMNFNFVVMIKYNHKQYNIFYE